MHFLVDLVDLLDLVDLVRSYQHLLDLVDLARLLAPAGPCGPVGPCWTLWTCWTWWALCVLFCYLYLYDLSIIFVIKFNMLTRILLKIQKSLQMDLFYTHMVYRRLGMYYNYRYTMSLNSCCRMNSRLAVSVILSEG